jgi:hypothetical protein
VTTTDVAASHGTVLELVQDVEGVGHKIFMNKYSYFTSPKLFSDLHHGKINACSIIHHNKKEMPSNFSPKHLQLIRGDPVFRVRGNLWAVCWKMKREVYALSNTHITPAEGNFKEGGKSVNYLIMEECTTHMGYVHLSDKMANSYSVSKESWKWRK